MARSENAVFQIAETLSSFPSKPGEPVTNVALDSALLEKGSCKSFFFFSCVSLLSVIRVSRGRVFFLREGRQGGEGVAGEDSPPYQRADMGGVWKESFHVSRCAASEVARSEWNGEKEKKDFCR